MWNILTRVFCCSQLSVCPSVPIGATSMKARPTVGGPPAQVIFAACCLVFFISIIFLHNHNSMAYVHSTIQDTLDAPVGWLQSTSRTTVRAVTIHNAAGEAVTQAAMTATTTTTTVAASSSSSSSRHRMARMHTTTHWKPSLLSRYVFGNQLVQHNSVQVARVVAASLPDVERDIELHPARVAQVVQQAKETEALQQLAQGPGAANTHAATTPEYHAGLHGAAGGGSVMFQITPDMSSCPEGSATPGMATAMLLLADSHSGAAALQRALDGLLLRYRKAGADTREVFHLFVVLDGQDDAMQHLAHQYALDSLGILKLVQYSRSTSTPTEAQLHSINNSSTHSLSAAAAAGLDAAPSNSVPHAVRAEHVALMLHTFLDCLQYQSVLLLEDDWQLLPGFLEYFATTKQLLASDRSLFCVSAWNPLSTDQHQHPHTQSRLMRVDTNPGRGWLVGRDKGLQLLHAWSQQPDMQQHRHSWGHQSIPALGQCIAPERPFMLPAAVHDADRAAQIDTAPTVAAAAAAAGIDDPGAAMTAAAATPVVGSGSTAGTDRVVEQKTAVVDVPVAREVEPAWPTHEALHDVFPTMYQQLMQQRVSIAWDVDAATAAQSTDTSAAVRVSYSTAEELSAVAAALQLPLAILHNTHSCYMLPTTPPTQHCQEFLPDMSYDGIITAFNTHGVRVYLMHRAYSSALVNMPAQHDTAGQQQQALQDTAPVQVV